MRLRLRLRLREREREREREKERYEGERGERGIEILTLTFSVGYNLFTQLR